MQTERLIRTVDRETGKIGDDLSPSKIGAWIVVVLVVAYAGIWLWQMADPELEPMSSELVLGAVVAGGLALAYAMYNRPGDVLDEALNVVPGTDRGG